MMPAALYAQPADPHEKDHRLRAVLASGIPAQLHESLERRFNVKLAYFKIPRYWSAIGSLPMTPSERVAKGQLVATAKDLPVWDSAGL